MIRFLQNAVAAVCLLTASTTLPAGYGNPQAVDYRLESLDASVEAFVGQPFGIGVVTLNSNGKNRSWWKEPTAVELELLGPSAFYPVVERIGTGSGEPQRSDERRIYFLFKPEQATDVSILGKSFKLDPITDDVKHRELLSRWWKRYVAQSNAIREKDQYPAQVEQYLTEMLARRLKLSVPNFESSPFLYDAEVERSIGLLTGAEAMRLALQKDSLLGSSRNEVATEDLPKATSPPAIAIPEPAADVAVEAIAMVVPPECLYARFTKYEDLEWFGEMLDVWGTELNGALTQRGLKYDARQRVQDQLNLHQTELAKQLSAAVVKDYAVIGTDTFLREGAGIGVLFQATSGKLLSAYLTEQRLMRAAKGDGVVLSEIQFEGMPQTGSMLASPDNRVRSIYVTSGDFHLVTTSAAIAKRFLQTCDDREKSLGASKEFRYARTVTPVDRNDSAFVYLSDSFFRSFVDPACRIEMTRRAASESEIELVELAMLTARSEGHPCATLEDLIAGELLPPEFFKRADSSQLILKNGVVVDSLRGARGAFLPIADVRVEKATKSEIAGYEKFAQTYRRIWTWMDPATLAFQRHVDGQKERLVLDLHLYPYPRRELVWLDIVNAKKQKQRLAPLPGVLFVAEANIFGGTPVFAGLFDSDIPVVLRDGKIAAESTSSKNTPMFVGESGSQSMLFGPPGKAGKSGEIVPVEKGRDFFGIGEFEFTEGSYRVMAPMREALEPLVGNLSLVEAERPAELRMHIGDVANAKLSPYLNAGIWCWSNSVAQGQVDLLNRFVTQFHVPVKESNDMVNRVLNARLVSPIGGSYQPSALAAGFHSYVVLNDAVGVSAYRHPLLKRLRSADFELTTEGTTLISHAEVVLDLP